jgi:hypothetical protein
LRVVDVVGSWVLSRRQNQLQTNFDVGSTGSETIRILLSTTKRSVSSQRCATYDGDPCTL